MLLFYLCNISEHSNFNAHALLHKSIIFFFFDHLHTRLLTSNTAVDHNSMEFNNVIHLLNEIIIHLIYVVI